MKRHKIFFIAIICAIAPVFCAPAAVSKCQKTSMQRCLDSACAINIGMNPSARCQYCGTSSAGNPPSQKGLSNITAGQSTKYVLTNQELRVAPSDPGRRYIWATTECIKKLPDCTTDDVSDLYDKLIEQSCKAAGVSMQVTSAMEAINKKPTKSSCNDTFTTCVNKKCGTAYENCEDGTTFTKTIAECATEASGCDDYITEFRNALQTTAKACTLCAKAFYKHWSKIIKARANRNLPVQNRIAKVAKHLILAWPRHATTICQTNAKTTKLNDQWLKNYVSSIKRHARC